MEHPKHQNTIQLSSRLETEEGDGRVDTESGPSLLLSSRLQTKAASAPRYPAQSPLTSQDYRSNESTQDACLHVQASINQTAHGAIADLRNELETRLLQEERKIVQQARGLTVEEQKEHLNSIRRTALYENVEQNGDHIGQTLIERLFKILMHKYPRKVQQFLLIDENQRNLETYIGMHDLAIALDFFVAIDPDHIQSSIVTRDQAEEGLTDEQQILLDYVKCLRNDMIAPFFEKARVEGANLARFDEVLQTQFMELTNQSQSDGIGQQQKQLDLLLSTKSDRLKMTFLSCLTAEDLIELIRRTHNDHSNAVFRLITLCENHKLEKIKALMDAQTRDSFLTWISVLETMGHSPEFDYRGINEVKQGLERETDLDKSFVNHECNQCEGLTEVGMQRSIDLPQDPLILDQLVTSAESSKQTTFIVRIERSNIKCTAAFRIDEEFEIRKSIQLKQGFQLTVQKLNHKTGKFEMQLSTPIDEPVPFRDACEEGEKTLVFEGQSGEVFWFSETLKGGLNINILPHDSLMPVETKINVTSELYKHMMQDSFISKYEKAGEALGDKLEDMQDKLLSSKYLYMTAVPRLFTINDGTTQLIAFSHHRKNAPAVLFYDVAASKEILRVNNAEMFLWCFQVDSSKQNEWDIMFYTSPEVQGKANQQQRADLKFHKFKFSQRRNFESIHLNASEKQGDEMPQALLKLKVSQREQCFNARRRAAKIMRVQRPIQAELPSFAICFDSTIVINDTTVQSGLSKNLTVTSTLLSTTSLDEKLRVVTNLLDGQRKQIMRMRKRPNDMTELQCIIFRQNSSHAVADVVFTREINMRPSTIQTAIEVTKDNFRIDLIDDEQKHIELTCCPVMQNLDYRQSLIGFKRDKTWFLTQKTKVGQDLQAQQFVVDIKQRDPMNEWRVCVDHPLVLYLNIKRPSVLIVENLMEQQRNRVLFRFEDIQVIAFDQVEPMKQTYRAAFTLIVSQSSEQGMIVNPKNTLDRITLNMKRPFQKDALSALESWQIENEQNDKIPHFLGFNSNIDQQTFNIDTFLVATHTRKAQSSTCIVYTTESDAQNGSRRIRLISDTEQKDLVDSETAEICHVAPIRSYNGLIFFVEKEKVTHINHIVELTLTFDNLQRQWRHKRRRVFSTASDVRVLQLVRTSQQLNDNSDKLVPIKLYVLDQQLNLYTITQRIGASTYKQVKKMNLQSIEGIQDWINSYHDSFENICISRRALVIRDRIFALQSGNQYELFQSGQHHSFVKTTTAKTDRLQEEDQDIEFQGTVVVPQSDYLMTRCMRVDEDGHQRHSLIFENDPGRRNRSLFGARHLRNILALHFISTNLLLVLFGEGCNEFYYNFVTLNGRLVDMSSELHSCLKYFCSDAIIKSCIVRGNICKLLLISCKKESPRVIILELSSRGELISKREVTVENTYLDEKQQVQIYSCTEIRMNRRGKLLQLRVKTSHSNDIKPNFIPKLDATGVNSIDFELEFDDTQSQFVFVGDFVFWTTHDLQQIQFVKVPQAWWSTGRKVLQPKTILLKKYFGHVFANGIRGIAIDACEPSVAARMSQSGLLTKDAINDLGNRLQVTVKDMVKVFDVKEDGIVLAGELIATKSLLDPQFFVETEHQVATIVKHDSGYYKQCLIATQLGHLVIHRQSRSLVKRKRESDIAQYCPRKVLGIYAKFAGIDYLEALDLIMLSRKKKTPSKIEIDALFASFGHETMFTLLPGKGEQSDNPKILRSIIEALQNHNFAKLREIEDEYGQTQLNPNLRRWSDILLKNTQVQLNRSKENGPIDMQISSNLVFVTGKNFEVRNALLDLGMMSPDFSILKGLCGQEDFELMLKDCSSQVIAALNNCTFETHTTSLIDHCVWPVDNETKLLSYASKDCMVEKSELETAIKLMANKYRGMCCCRKVKLENKAVKVSMINIDWLLRDGFSLTNFANICEKKPDDLYDTELIRYMLMQNWPSIRYKILQYRVLPQLLQLVFQNWQIFAVLKYDSLDQAFESAAIKIRILNVICMLLQACGIFLELFQLRGMSKSSEYFCKWWNMLDLVSLGSSTFISVNVSLRVDYISIEALRAVAAVASFTLLFKLYDWMRLYKVTAFITRLLFQSIQQMKYFMGMLVISLFAFGVPMLLLSFNGETGHGEDDDLLFAAFLRMYLTMLGEFSIGNWEEDDSDFLRGNQIIFIAATFFVVINMLNMLIAILSDVFAKVYERKDTFSRETQLQFISETEDWMLPSSQKVKKSAYLFIIKPVSEEQGDNDKFQNAITALSQATQENAKVIENKLQAQIEVFERLLDSRTNQLSKQFTSMDERFSLVERQVSQLVEQKQQGGSVDSDKSSLGSCHSNFNSNNKPMDILQVPQTKTYSPSVVRNRQAQQT